MDISKISDKDKIIQGKEAFLAFFDSLGESRDIYKQVLLEEFFKILLEEKSDLSIFDEKK